MKLFLNILFFVLTLVCAQFLAEANYGIYYRERMTMFFVLWVFVLHGQLINVIKESKK